MNFILRIYIGFSISFYVCFFLVSIVFLLFICVTPIVYSLYLIKNFHTLFL